jgi:GNAT superfamily N-acetyltransferase
MTISTTQATWTDLPVLAALFDGYRQFYGRPSDRDAALDFLQERLRLKESVILMAWEGGDAVGFTQLYPSFSSVSMARTFILNDLFVTSQARQRGVGRLLLQQAAAYAQSVGAIRLTLSTATTNQTAQSLYESAGWVRDQQFYVYQLTV